MSSYLPGERESCSKSTSGTSSRCQTISSARADHLRRHTPADAWKPARMPQFALAYQIWLAAADAGGLILASCGLRASGALGGVPGGRTKFGPDGIPALFAVLIS